MMHEQRPRPLCIPRLPTFAHARHALMGGWRAWLSVRWSGSNLEYPGSEKVVCRIQAISLRGEADATPAMPGSSINCIMARAKSHGNQGFLA
jgi:hypothetical protein